MEHNETDDTTVRLPEATNETNSTIASPQHPENQHFPRAKASPVSSQHSHRPAKAMGSSPVEWCNRFVSFGLGYALSGSGGSSCPVGWGVSRDLVRMSRLR